MKMNQFTQLSAAAIGLCIAIGSARAAEPESNAVPGEHTGANGAVNSICPIGKEAIDPEVPTIDYKGNTIGFCCPGCSAKFMAWSEKERDFFVAAAKAGTLKAEPKAEQPAPLPGGEPYPLSTCSVSGQKLGSMGDPIVRMYEGREVRFCCAGCIDKFEADTAGYFEKIDAQIIEDQLPLYPVMTCVVSGESLTEGGEDIATNMVYGNRLVRLCCKMCEKDFKADPQAFLSKLDKAVAESQRADYPLDTCVVRGGELGAMGEPVEVVRAGRLVRLCCSGCIKKLDADPATYLGALDAAWKVKGGKHIVHANESDEHEDTTAHAGHDHEANH